MSRVQILFENEYLAVAVKPCGVLSEDTGDDSSMPGILREALGCDVFPIHRLDRAVGGTMLFAKNRKGAAYLSDLVSRGLVKKEYLAVVDGAPDETGEMTDLLFKDSSKNKSFVVKRMRRGVKSATLRFERMAKTENVSLVKVELVTGRSHQIRVQFASRGMPLLGDGKYGSRDGKCQIALWCFRLTFPGRDGETLVFSSLPEEHYPWDLFRIPDIPNNSDRKEPT